MSHITPSLTPDSSEKCETESLLLFVDKGSPPCCPREGWRPEVLDRRLARCFPQTLEAFLTHSWSTPLSPHSLSLSLLLRSCSLHLHLSLLLFLQQLVGPPLILSRAERSRVECMRARPASDRAEQHSPSATAPALARSLGASLAASCAHMHSVPLRSALLQARFLGRSRRPPPRQRRAR